MKKRIKELLFMGVLILIGISCIYLMCLRSEQINNNEVSYEKFN